jgi:hypothetical protein
MFISKTKDIFVRRLKRIKKLKDKDESSDEENKTSSFGEKGSLSFSF